MFTNFEMNENLFNAQYNVTKKSKLSKFYESNKVLIYSVVSILIISLASIIFYLEKKEKEKTLLAESYIEAVVYSKNGDRNKAVNILREVIFANDSTYSVLSLFLIIEDTCFDASISGRIFFTLLTDLSIELFFLQISQSLFRSSNNIFLTIV